MGWLAPMHGSNHIIPVIGPLSTSPKGIKLFMKTILDAKPWINEPSLLPIPWREDQVVKLRSKSLKIGVLWDDGVVKPHPPVTRALKEVVERLEQLPDIKVVEWRPHRHEDAWSMIASLYFPDGGADEAKAIDSSGEPWLPLSKFIIKENEFVKRFSIEELWAWQYKRDLYWSEYAALWNETATGTDTYGNPEAMMDAILCPAGPGAAPLLETARWWGYTSQCRLMLNIGTWSSDQYVGNLLDYPAAIFPVSVVDPMVDIADESYRPRNAKDEYNWKNCESALLYHQNRLISLR